MTLRFHGIRRWLSSPKSLLLAITFAIAASWYLIMSYTPNVTPELEPLTFPYKTVKGSAQIHLDIYSPSFAHYDNAVPNKNANGNAGPATVPVVLYFHGGGLTVGNRKSWFPMWLHKRVTAAGYAFISADYRLIPPATGHDIIDDIKDVFRFIRDDLNSNLSKTMSTAGYETFPRYQVDPDAIAVVGSSAGGTCAYYSLQVSPKPKALVLLYAMGGDYLTPQYLTEKTVPFFRGREILDRAQYSEYLHPFPRVLDPISDSPLAYNPPSSPMPGYPTNPRHFLSRLYLQLGVWLDYLTGEHGSEHEPSLSDILRKSLASNKTDLARSAGSDAFDVINERLKTLIPERHHLLFPQFNITSDWPPMYMTHGELDSAVLVHESIHMHRLLKEAGVDVRLSVQEGKEHSFDYEPDAETTHGPRLFDSIAEFLKEHLEKARG